MNISVMNLIEPSVQGSCQLYVELRLTNLLDFVHRLVFFWCIIYIFRVFGTIDNEQSSKSKLLANDVKDCYHCLLL
jgi:hypothetical protein